jgi:hypothetical protein
MIRGTITARVVATAQSPTIRKHFGVGASAWCRSSRIPAFGGPGCIIGYTRTPSLFIWGADETRVGIAKKHVASDIIVAKNAPPGALTIVHERDHSQMTAPQHLFISKNSIFETKR